MSETLELLLVWLVCLTGGVAIGYWQWRKPESSRKRSWLALALALSMPIPVLKIDSVLPGGALLLYPLLEPDAVTISLLAGFFLLLWLLVLAILTVMGRRRSGRG